MNNWFSIIPFIIVIPIAIKTKLIIPGLTIGLLIGSYIIEPSPLGGLQKMLAYLVDSLKEENNIKIIIFLYIFSGLIEIIKIAGGIKGFVELVSHKIKTKTGALLLTWFSTIGTFSAPTFRIVTISPIMKALLKKVKISSQELAFMIETTAAPIIVLIPIATAFVGYMTSIIQSSLKYQGLKLDAYTLFLKSIPFNFFSISIIILGIYLSFFHHSNDTDMAIDSKKKGKNNWEDCHPVVAKDLPSKPLNLLIPLFLLLTLTFLITWLDGYEEGLTISQAFMKADVLESMVIASLITLFLTVIFFQLQHLSFGRIIYHFIIGGNELMKVIILLTAVWALSAVTEDLGFSKFITTNTKWIPGSLIPPILFLIGSFISYIIGSSWGTWGILMPLGISLAQAANINLPIIIGTVFASGTFGAFASPLSGNTVTITKIFDLPLLKYSNYKLKPALIAAGFSTILYFIASFIY